MDFDVYVAARRGRLVERAMELGCPEELAAGQVDRVLADHRRTIQRNADPDPLVHEALDRSLAGESVRRGKGRAIAAAAVATAALAGVVAVTYEPPMSPVPSLFGYDAAAAETLLEAKGYDVLLEPIQVCEPVGQVLGSWPRAGEPVKQGARVTVYTAVPSGFFCPVHYLDREDAWEFVRFALGGPAPSLADTVEVALAADEPVTLTGPDVARHASWGGTLQLLVDAARTPTDPGTQTARLTVSSDTPPRTTCAAALRETAGQGSVLRLQIETRRVADESSCPLTIDLYREDRVIHSVVFHPPTATQSGG